MSYSHTTSPVFNMGIQKGPLHNKQREGKDIGADGDGDGADGDGDGDKMESMPFNCPDEVV